MWGFIVDLLQVVWVLIGFPVLGVLAFTSLIPLWGFVILLFIWWIPFHHWFLAD